MRANIVQGRKLDWAPPRKCINHPLFLLTEASKLPKLVDLRARCGPVFDQGQIGSCSGNAIAGALDFLEIEEKGLGPQVYSKNFEAASRLFIYYCERDIEGSVDQDSGVQTVVDGAKAVEKFGAPSELLWPYQVSRVLTKPPLAVYQAAAKHKLTKYLVIPSFQAGLQCLAQGYPFALGFTVYESFMADATAKTGVMPLPKKGEKDIGGHAVLCVGYDQTKKVLIVRNSWGPGWGDKGHFYMPYAFADSELCGDFVTLRK